MKFYLLLLSAMFMALAWLLPIHYRPWVTYTGELYAFLALFSLSAIYLKDKIKLPLISLPLLLLALVPLLQYAVGKVFFFDKALLCSVFVFGFWLSSVLGYNLASSSPQAREQLFTQLSYLLMAVGAATGFIAFCQWVNLDAYLPGMVEMHGFGDRPFANFAQPNNMATFLLISLLACWYIYEKQKLDVKVLTLLAFLILLGIVVGQSRTSWVGSLCILIYAAYQHYKGVLHLKWYYVAMWVGLFLVLLLWALPWSGSIIAAAVDPVRGSERVFNIARRATGDMSRIAIWQQMLHAIMEQPLWGYGWHQTSVAYTLISDYFQGPVWIRSAHNFIIDFVIWNGMLVGLPFLAYFGYWGVHLVRRVNSVESVIGVLMVGVFVVHAMFEFPQNYAYFLLPIGFIIGIVQAQYAATRVLTLSPRVMQVTFVLGVGLIALIHRDYATAVPKLNQSIRYEHQADKLTNHDQIYVLDELNRRIEWIRMSPYTVISPRQMQEISEIVLNYPTGYDMLKYAKLLAFNGYEQQAQHQLWLLRELREIDVDYQRLRELEPKDVN